MSKGKVRRVAENSINCINFFLLGAFFPARRDEADSKLKQAMSKEYQQTVAQKHKMSELHQQIDHLRELKEFISIKGENKFQ